MVKRQLHSVNNPITLWDVKTCELKKKLKDICDFSSIVCLLDGTKQPL